MASINGIRIIGAKKFYGMEGPAYQGKISYNGKVLGFWSQDGDGGTDRYEFDESVLNGEMSAWKKATNQPDFVDVDCLLGDLIGLIEDEKAFKRGVKKGLKKYVRLVGEYQTVGINFNGEAGFGNEALRNTIETGIKRFAKGENVRIEFFTKESDFDVIYR